MPHRNLTVCLLLAAILTAFVATSCRRRGPTAQKPAAEADRALEQPLIYPPELSAASTPGQVAARLIRALDEDDEQTLRGLVAARHEKEQIDALFRKHGRRARTTPELAASLAAAGWRATYAFMEQGATRVEGEEIQGETAIVRASARLLAGGRPRRLIIYLLREDGLWKVRAGIEAREP